MQTKTSKVSIITPLYNSERFITQTITSVKSQTYTNWEMLIVDDCSTDNGYQIAADFAKDDERIRLFRLTENSGAGIARNMGIENADGEFIAFLDSDDIWHPDKLNKQIDYMKKTGADVCFSSYGLLDEKGNALNKKVQALSKVDFNKLLKSNYIGNLTAVYRVSEIGKVYSPQIRKRQDWALWLKILKKGHVAYGMMEVLADYRLRTDSLSSNKIQMLKHNYRVYVDFLGYSSSKSALLMLHFLWEHFFIKPKQIKPLD
tara:strand:+ start:194 stop:973 length:780 start_codon:yes stop_codon:yes gene_type:complete